MHVRLAERHEIDEFVRMAVANLEETMPGEPYIIDKLRGTFANYIVNASPTIMFCEHEGKVVGFTAAYIYEFDYRDGLYTTQRVIYVSPEHRGTRAAVLLIKELIRWSASLGADRIEGGNDNSFQTERTAKFLGHFGFETTGCAMRKVLRGSGDGRQKRR